jgi:hypothetical protein
VEAESFIQFYLITTILVWNIPSTFKLVKVAEMQLLKETTLPDE